MYFVYHYILNSLSFTKHINNRTSQFFIIYSLLLHNVLILYLKREGKHPEVLKNLTNPAQGGSYE